MKTNKFSQKTIENLGYYVYLYIDPFTNKVFYIGEGKSNRAFDHLRDPKESRKVAMIKKIRDAGKEPRIEILAHKLPNKDTALRIEAAAIDLIGVGRLANEVRGHHSAVEGRMTYQQAEILYNSKEIKVDIPAILIRINQLYKYDMTKTELYDAARGVWKIKRDRASGYDFAFAIYKGIVREVYRIKDWYKAGTTPYKTRSQKDMNVSGRWEFVGKIAPDDIRKKYIDKSVAKYFAENSQNPIRYINPVKKKNPKKVKPKVFKP